MRLDQLLLPALGTFISTFWWLTALFMLASILKLPAFKGFFGELQVNLAAKFFLNKKVYRLFRNVTLPTENGTTQIDHIIVSRYGVFVIETKNMKGWIYGSPQQKIWTQKIYRHTSQFQNPLHQNYKHTQTLQSVLELEPGKVFSLVVFVGDSAFKTGMPNNVVYAGGYIRFIKNKILPILSDSEIFDICEKIQSGRLTPSLKTHIDHSKHVKSLIDNKQRQDDHSCPNCGKPMILRTARSGQNQGRQFLGCSDYPKCRTVRQIA